MAMWWGAFFLLLAMGGVLVVIARRWEAEAGIPGGRVVSVDLARDGCPALPMVDEALGLSGRPDLVLEERDKWIPLEIKSSKAPVRPYRSHVLQLAAYCRLIEVTDGRRPSHGILHYSDRTYSLPYTRPLEREMLRVLGRMQAQAGRLPARSHDEPARCDACGYASACDQRLPRRQAGEGGWL
jgi:CRISPR-associated exonuclease Cas4